VNLDRIIAWCAPWNDLFGHSKWISGTVIGLHIMALFISGGLAVAADRMTLRVPPGDDAARRAQLREVAAVHRIVLVGVIVLFVSGVLLAMADVETFLPSPLFWLKLVLAALLVVNGAMLTRTEHDLNGGERRGSKGATIAWARIRLLSMSSVLLWTATALVGIVLSNAL